MYVHTSVTTTFSRNYYQVLEYILIYKHLGKALQQGKATHDFLSTLRNTRGQHVRVRYTASMLQYHDHARCLASTQNGDALTSISFHRANHSFTPLFPSSGATTSHLTSNHNKKTTYSTTELSPLPSSLAVLTLKHAPMTAIVSKLCCQNAGMIEA